MTHEASVSFDDAYPQIPINIEVENGIPVIKKCNFWLLYHMIPFREY